ncbi:MAG: RNA polymerase sigma factor [Candidatus Hydrogenedentes bacterium]|nr:RNA polymerase sigma factor [Candidatus Hydrogenedentota bacterium]
MDDFPQQVERYKDEFYRYVLRVVWDSSVADDVFSSAVLAAWENRGKFTPGTNFRAWMYRIITNKCYVANREISRTPAPIDDVPEMSLLALREDRSYFDVLQDPETFLQQCGEELHQAMKQLSTSQRTCILLRSVEKFSYKEIAEIMGIPVGTVMTHLSRGRARLRAELMEYAQARGLVRARPRLLPKVQPGDRRAQGDEP